MTSSVSSNDNSTSTTASCDCDDVTATTPSKGFTVIQIEGQHNKQIVDTRDGVVRVVDERSASPASTTILPTESTFINENPRCCCGPGTCNCTDCSVCVDRQEKKMKKVRLKLKRSRGKKIKEEAPEESQTRLPVPEKITPKVEEKIEIEEVFVSVGNGLYRRERRNKLTGEVLKDEDAPKNTGGCCSAKKPSEPAKSSCCSKPVKSSCCKSETTPKHNTEKSRPSMSAPKPSQTRAAPLIIAPMNFDGLEISNFDFSGVLDHFAKQGANNTPTNNSSPHAVTSGTPEDYYPTIANVGIDEPHSLSYNMEFDTHFTNPSPQSAFGQNVSFTDFDYLSIAETQPHTQALPRTESDFLDVVYAPSCVLPGQCQCGDTCSCEGCSTHGNGGARVQIGASPSVSGINSNGLNSPAYGFSSPMDHSPIGMKSVSMGATNGGQPVNELNAAAVAGMDGLYSNPCGAQYAGTYSESGDSRSNGPFSPHEHGQLSEYASIVPSPIHDGEDKHHIKARHAAGLMPNPVGDIPNIYALPE